MKKVLLVFGTRPEAIKMAPLVKCFVENSENFETVVCVTGQHREMLDQVLRLFDITPDYDLNIMKQGQDLYDVTSRVLLGMRDVLKEVQPDVPRSDRLIRYRIFPGGMPHCGHSRSRHRNP